MIERKVAVQLPWVEYVEYFLFLSGNKVDLRNDPDTVDKLGKINSGPVKQMDGRKTAETIGAEVYVECSAKTRQGVREAFETAARITLRADKRRARTRGGRCVLQ